MIKESTGMIKYSSWREPEWHQLYFDALKEKKGFILAGYGLLSLEAAETHPITSIYPPTIPGIVNMVCIGLRDLIESINLIPIRRCSIKFDVSGDSQDAMESNKHLVKYNSCNISEILNVPIDIPLNPLFSPVISVYVFDHVLNIIGERLVGIAHIPLDRIVKKFLRKLLEDRKGGMTNSFAPQELGFNDIANGPAEAEESIDDKKYKEYLNSSLQKLEMLIDNYEVDLEVTSEDTEEEAINEAIMELIEQEDKQNSKNVEEDEADRTTVKGTFSDDSEESKLKTGNSNNDESKDHEDSHGSSDELNDSRTQRTKANISRNSISSYNDDDNQVVTTLVPQAIKDKCRTLKQSKKVKEKGEGSKVASKKRHVNKVLTGKNLRK